MVEKVVWDIGTAIGVGDCFVSVAIAGQQATLLIKAAMGDM